MLLVSPMDVQCRLLGGWKKSANVGSQHSSQGCDGTQRRSRRALLDAREIAIGATCAPGKLREGHAARPPEQTKSTTHILDYFVHRATCFEGIQRRVHQLLLTPQTHNYIIPASQEAILADRNHSAQPKLRKGEVPQFRRTIKTASGGAERRR